MTRQQITAIVLLLPVSATMCAALVMLCAAWRSYDGAIQVALTFIWAALFIASLVLLSVVSRVAWGW